MAPALTLSVIVPAYNEQDTVVDLLERVAAQSIEGVEIEVIVVDDGSTDETGERVAKRPDLFRKLIRRPRNGGKGAAVRDGLKAATGDYVLFQDADLEYDPAEYRALLHPVRELEADLVLGSRNLAPKYVRVFYFWHLVGNRILTLFFNLLFNTTFTDIYSCYLLCRRELIDVDRLRAMGWSQHAEILCTAAGRAKAIYEVPISYHGRSYGEGKKIRAHHVLPVFLMIVKKRLARLFGG